jgi:hypothetical protein
MPSVVLALAAVVAGTETRDNAPNGPSKGNKAECVRGF